MNAVSKLALAQSMTNTTRKRPNKYNAVKTVVDGKLFHSKKEARVYAQLALREKAGEIKDLECQVKIPLLAYAGEGQSSKIATYIVDFKFYDMKEARLRYVDAKGVKTALFNLKAKIVNANYGITVEIV